ncbi:DNA-binding protein [Herbaspirillum seropedicae]|uniref:DNA-binding protein n=1 Tax=Herbaspirillum seropedicae TaxID=964 RepID=UPI002866E947|nr:DNA-binding protein [Herbaspirillum seropedicae]MDR6395898.1 hypothetical protein [Herbaspirillum seropedicae]
MNQNTQIIKLVDIAGPTPFGNVAGKTVFNSLVEIVNANPNVKNFGISLEGIRRTDASFPRESVLSVAKFFQGEHGFFLCDIDLRDILARDIIDNWHYAALAKDFPLVVWGMDKDFQVIGPYSDPTATIVNLVLNSGSITAAKVAVELDTSVQNASTRLKKLSEQGYFLRSEVGAESGGKEFIYQAIK